MTALKLDPAVKQEVIVVDKPQEVPGSAVKEVAQLRVISRCEPSRRAPTLSTAEMSRDPKSINKEGYTENDIQLSSYKPIDSQNPTATREEKEAKEKLADFMEERRGRNGSTANNTTYLKGIMLQVVQGSSKVKTAEYAIIVTKKGVVTSWTVFFCKLPDFYYVDFVREMYVASHKADVGVWVTKISDGASLVDPLSFPDFCKTEGLEVPPGFSWEKEDVDSLFDTPETAAQENIASEGGVKRTSVEKIPQEDVFDQETEMQPATFLGKLWKLIRS